MLWLFVKLAKIFRAVKPKRRKVRLQVESLEGRWVPSATITGFTPDAGPLTGTTVTITGTNLANATEVDFGSTAVMAASFTSPATNTQIVLTSPAEGVGSVEITVKTPDATNGSVTDTTQLFTYDAQPVLTSISPASGGGNGGTSVTITGTNFNGASTVDFGSTPASSLIVNPTDTQIVATASAGTGLVDVTVVTPGGTSAVTQPADQFQYTPAVTSVVAASGPTSGNTTVTINGDDLAGASAVDFGTAAATIVGTPTANQVVVTTPTGQSAGTVDVTVTTPVGTSAVSPPDDSFTFVAAPAVASISPSTGPGNGGTLVTITGTNLSNPTAVDFGTAAITTFTNPNDSATQIIVDAPAGTGQVPVTVTTVGGLSNATVMYQYTPAVLNVVSDSGLTTGGNTVVIGGADLAGATSVNFGTTTVLAAAFSSDTASQIVLKAPAGVVGTVDVTVTTPDGTSAVSSADEYTYVAPQTPTPELSALEGTVTANGTVIPGVTISLSGITTGGAAFTLATQTDSNGNYLFNQLEAGTYSLTRSSTNLYVGGTSSVGNLGGSPGTDSIGSITLQSGEVATGYDFAIGNVALQEINLSDYLSISVDDFSSLIPAGAGNSVAGGLSQPNSGQKFGDGSTAVNVISGSVQNQSNTTGIAGVQVYLTGIDYTGLAINPEITTTDGNGNYQFANVNPGTYSVEVVVPSGDQAVSAAAGPLGGGFSQFNSEIYDIDVATSDTAATYSSYNFQVTPAANSGAGTAPLITAGLADDTGTTFTADPAIQGTVTPGADQAPITQLLVGVNVPSGPPTFDATANLVNGSFYLNEATLAQIAGFSDGTLPDGVYNVSIEAVDAQGNSSILPITQFTLATTPPASPTMTVQTTSGSVLNSSSTSLGTLVNATGGVVITNPNAVNPATSGDAQTITLTGTIGTTPAGMPAPTVTIFTAGSNTSSTAATVNNTNGTFTANVTLSQAITNFTVEVTNAAGVSSFYTMFVNLSQPLTPATYAATATPDPLAITTTSTSTVVNLADGFTDANAGNVIVKLTTSDGPVYIELFAGATPQSVDNFLAYISSDNYNQAIFSRLVSDFVLQGGEYQLQSGPTSLATITTLSPFNGEVGIDSNPSASNHNLAGTLAMALPSGATSGTYNDDGATDQFFFNLSDDSSLSANTSGNNLDADFAVFGQVLSGADMRVINSLASVPTQNEASATPSGDLTNLPLNNYTGSSFPADATPSNFDLISLATVVSQSDVLTYSVNVSDPSNVLSGDTTNSSSFVPLTTSNGKINTNDTLGLNFNTGVSGVVTLHVTATDLAGNSTTQTFTVTVGTVASAVPTVTAVSPVTGSANGGTVVTITGSDFTGATAVSFGSTPAANFTVLSDTQITAVAPVGTVGTDDITVVNAKGTSAISSADEFTYAAPPAVTSLNPTGGSLGGGTSVTITGTDLTGASAVSFGGVPATSFVVNSATQVTAVAPAEAAGNVNVTVTTPFGTSPTTTADQFAFDAQPAVTAVSPNAGSTSGGTSVTISGSSFTPATAVAFNGVPATSFVVNSNTQITAVAPAGSAGQVDITVTSPGGTSTTSSADQFTYAAPPAVTSLTPTGGGTGGGTSVTITGSGLTGASAVSFGGVPAVSFVVNSDTQITAVAPTEAVGEINITVTTPEGTSPTTAADQFTFVAPAVTSVNPTGGSTLGGTSVTISGSGFTGATAVSFGGVPAAGFTVNSDAQITAVAPPGTGMVDITVANPEAVSPTSSADQFTYS